MKTIIALSGVANTGKTETLNLLIDLLEVETTGCPIPSPQPKGCNRKKTFSYKGSVISICTAGDNEAELNENVNYFAKKNTDIAISAARSKGKTRTVLDNLAKQYGIKVLYISKVVHAQNKTQINEKQAKELVKLILSLII